MCPLITSFSIIKVNREHKSVLIGKKNISHCFDWRVICACSYIKVIVGGFEYVDVQNDCHQKTDPQIDLYMLSIHISCFAPISISLMKVINNKGPI